MRGYRDGVIAGNGRLETKLLGRVIATTAAANAFAGNGSRVGLILALSGEPEAVTTGRASVGKMNGGQYVPFGTLSYGQPSLSLTYDQIGDALLGQIATENTLDAPTMTVWEVVWQPEKV